VNDAVMNRGSGQVPALNFLEYIPRNGIAESYDYSAFNCYTVFHAGAPFYIPISSAQEFHFLYIFALQ
jgi:hypothetical protein